MPGFNIGGQGDGPANTTETRRKHRWTLQTMGKGSSGDFAPDRLLLLKEASRPHFIFEEPVMHHNQEEVYFAGKQKWDPIKLVWYDAENPDISADMWDWLNKGILVSIGSANVHTPSQYKKRASLQMLRADGMPSETWQMDGCWCKDLQWNNLDYGDTEIATIEVEMRYDRANRK